MAGAVRPAAKLRCWSVARGPSGESGWLPPEYRGPRYEFMSVGIPRSLCRLETIDDWDALVLW